MYILFNLNLNDLFSFFYYYLHRERERERENLMRARGEKKIIIITYKTVIIMDIG